MARRDQAFLSRDAIYERCRRWANIIPVMGQRMVFACPTGKACHVILYPLVVSSKGNMANKLFNIIC